jgi:hypothetical protein
MSHVLSVPTLEIRNPVTFLVDVKADDPPRHARRRAQTVVEP